VAGDSDSESCIRGTNSLMFGKIVLGLGFVLLLSGCPTVRTDQPRQPEQIDVHGPYQHTASGMIFPASVGDYIRERIMRYDRDALDVSVGYNLIRPPRILFATVYVYPAPSVVSILSPPHVAATARSLAAKNEYARSKHEILQSHPLATLLGEVEASLVKGNATYQGWKAIFELDGARFGQREKVISYLYVFSYIGGSWTVKYRFTHPKSIEETQEIETFLRNLEWTFKSSLSVNVPGIIEIK